MGEKKERFEMYIEPSIKQEIECLVAQGKYESIAAFLREAAKEKLGTENSAAMKGELS
jgi:Arc/MetJ-type ribon-helix-helix transcriptional regulator